MAMGVGGEGGSRGGAPPPRGAWRLWNLKGPEWRTAGWLGALLLAGLLLLSTTRGAGAGATHTPAAGAPAAATAVPGGDPLLSEAAAIAADLTQALEAIAGAGSVTVRVHLQEGPVTEFAANTQVTDQVSAQSGQSGGDQTTTQHSESSQLAAAATGGGTPVRAIAAPTITGVLVVAAGARDPTVRAELTAAVLAATAVALYRIVVVPAAAG